MALVLATIDTRIAKRKYQGEKSRQGETYGSCNRGFILHAMWDGARSFSKFRPVVARPGSVSLIPSQIFRRARASKLLRAVKHSYNAAFLHLCRTSHHDHQL